MRITYATVPQLREDIELKTVGDRRVAEDAVRRVRVPVDRLTQRIMVALVDEPVRSDTLCEQLEASRMDVFRRVALLNRHLMLATPRAAEQLGVAVQSASAALWDRADLKSAPLSFPDGLVHGCVACGACCHGTDVGPLKADDIAKIREIDWTEHLPSDVGRHDWLVETQDDRGDTVTLMGTRRGRCVFLGDDKLCIVHKVAGAEQKPTICRQFPYTFTRTPRGIDISFSMECRSWWQAKQGGRPVEEDVDGIRKLITEGGPVVDIPLPVPVWDGVDLDLDGWMAWREAALTGVRAAPSFDALIMAIVAPAKALWTDALERHAASEAFTGRAGWGLPVAEGPPSDAIERFFASCARLRDHIDDGMAALRDAYREHNELTEADRAEQVRTALVDLLRGRRVDDLVRFESELEIWRDLALASLYAHEPARRQPLLFGVARLAMTLCAGRLMAGKLAQTALRGRTSEQDVVDSMVLLTKMLRGSVPIRMLRASQRDLVELFLLNAEVFAAGTAPRPVDARFDAP